MEELTDIQSIIHAVQDQRETIGLLQAELSFQKERIDKQEGIIQELTTKVETLTSQLAEKKSEDEKNEESTNIWKDTANLTIAEAVKETAEKALMTNLGFVFDPNTRLYCNYSTGYYYDPGQELFYNGHTGTYYTYDADNQKYLFHSQVNIEQQQPKNTGEKKSKRNRHGESKSKISSQALRSPHPQTFADYDEWEPEPRIASIKKSKPKVKTKILKSEHDPEDMEEGELSDGSCSDDEDVEIVGEYYSTLDFENSSCSSTVDLVDEEHEHAPCIRAIIMESCAPATIKKGSLFLVTCMGGTIGRMDNSTISLPDSSVDKLHATIVYSLDGDGDDDVDDNNKTKKKYFINDAGSSTGTVLNGTRLSEPPQSSEPHEIVHGSIVKIGGFSILMHIHPGSFTCGHCEPGLLLTESSQDNSQSTSYQNEKPKSRNALMKQIKKKYGIDGRAPTAASQNLPDSDNYKDRACERRLKKGSDNPYEKTQVVTADESISENNKGFKMLAKMGWKEGKSLGNADNNGLLEPIKLELKNDRAGLGMVKVESTPSSAGAGHKKKGKNSKASASISNRADQLAITLKRFKEATEVKMEFDENPSKL